MWALFLPSGWLATPICKFKYTLSYHVHYRPWCLFEIQLFLTSEPGVCPASKSHWRLFRGPGFCSSRYGTTFDRCRLNITSSGLQLSLAFLCDNILRPFCTQGALRFQIRSIGRLERVVTLPGALCIRTHLYYGHSCWSVYNSEVPLY